METTDIVVAPICDNTAPTGFASGIPVPLLVAGQDPTSLELTSDDPLLTGVTCDKILKSVLADPLLMEQLLHYYVCAKGYTDKFDYSTLRQLPTEYIDPSTGKYYYSDLAWEVTYHDCSQQPLSVTILLELQNSPCPPMAVRMLNYMAQFYVGRIRNRKQQETYPLPLILPLVLYTGLKKWSGPLDIRDLLPDLPDEFWQVTMSLQFNLNLLDVSRLDVRADEGSLLALFFACLQGYTDFHEWPKWRDIASLLHKMGRDAAREAWMQLYGMMITRNQEDDEMSAEWVAEKIYPRTTAEELAEIDAYLDALQAQGDIVPIGTRIRLKGRAEGRAEGMAEGRAEGIAEGRATGMAATVSQMVALRYANCPQRILQLIRESSALDFLDRVSRAFATTSTYEEFLESAGLR